MGKAVPEKLAKQALRAAKAIREAHRRQNEAVPGPDFYENLARFEAIDKQEEQARADAEGYLAELILRG